MPADAAMCDPSGTTVDPLLSLFCSEEIGGTRSDQRSRVNELDDVWAGAAGPRRVVGRIEERELPVILGDSDGFVVTVSLRDIADEEILDADSVGSPATTQGKIAFADVLTMQEGAPKPEFLVGEAVWNEEAGSTKSRNAVLFEFSQSVSAFGAWFGDLETRTDGQGVPALIRLLKYDQQSSLARVGADFEVQTSTADQGNCGDHGAGGGSTIGCGSRTTRWIGFAAKGEGIDAMLVVVGDDDDLSPKNGYTEHISFIGPTVARKGDPPPTTPTVSPTEAPSIPWANCIYLPIVLRNSRFGPRIGSDVVFAP
jgi:hypothetical protein